MVKKVPFRSNPAFDHAQESSLLPTYSAFLGGNVSLRGNEPLGAARKWLKKFPSGSIPRWIMHRKVPFYPRTPLFLKRKGGFGGKRKTSFPVKRSFPFPPVSPPLLWQRGAAAEVLGEVGHGVVFGDGAEDAAGDACGEGIGGDVAGDDAACADDATVTDGDSGADGDVCAEPAIVTDFDAFGVAEAADIAVCPANACDEVKKIADFVLCDHNEGLIADVVAKIESGELKMKKKRNTV